MSDISILGNKIITYAKQLGRNLDNILSPPLDEEEIKKQLATINMEPIEDITDLYSWQNGRLQNLDNILGDVWFFPGFLLMPLEDAVRKYILFKDDERWNPNWFPVFENCGGDFYVMDFSQTHNDLIPLVGFMIGEMDHPIEFQNLTAMFKTILACYEKGVFYIDEKKFFDVNDDKYTMVAKHYNPRIEFWTTGGNGWI